MKTKRFAAEQGAAFTLLELLVVIVIVGIIAAMALPVMNQFKPNYTASVTRTLLDELARARQLAISHRTTVYMVFVPTNFWNDPAFAQVTPVLAEKAKADKLLDKQLIGYSFVSVRSLGDQPGRPTVRYLSPWRSLPEGGFIPPQKFGDLALAPIYTNSGGTMVPAFPIEVFPKTTRIPFPSEFATPNPSGPPYYVRLPYIAFDYMGRLVRVNESTGQVVPSNNQIIPLAKGNIIYARNQATREALAVLPTVSEQPPGNFTNAFNLVAIDWLTGRARGIQQEVR